MTHRSLRLRRRFPLQPLQPLVSTNQQPGEGHQPDFHPGQREEEEGTKTEDCHWLHSVLERVEIVARRHQATPMEMTFECAWDTCDYQFEEVSDSGHVQQHYRGSGAGEYPCLWRSCARVRKGQAPFPNLPRLLRHVRDLHVNKHNGRLVAVHERSRNFVPSSKKATKIITTTGLRTGVLSPGAGMSPMARSTPSPSTGDSVGAGVVASGRPALEPLFIH
ncbi:unnamed protein product [Leptidea sinapis]|uniref:Uncharacterized protein n=1 Tax=Leptidea sinapis TaxID=189913 RepID=A0A5E4QP88_9NEOP|nr:unnamed protein product [Leptidea sinapis]